MTSNRSQLVLATSLFAACLLISIPAIAQTKPVLVVNGTGQPVPTAAQGTTTVAGTVNVGNTPNVNVTNTPNVNVANTPTVTVGSLPPVTLSGTPAVTVTNTPLEPVPTRDVDYPARHPFQETCGGNADQSGTAICSIGLVPANTEFVIQTLSAGISHGSAPFGGVQVTINNGTQLGGIQLPVIQQSSPNDSASSFVHLSGIWSRCHNLCPIREGDRAVPRQRTWDSLRPQAKLHN